MTIFTKAPRVASAITAAALAVGLATGVGAGAADAGPRATGARLSVSAPNQFNIHVVIEGVFRMSRIDAETIVKYMQDNRVGSVTYTLRGDDLSSDPVLFQRVVSGTGTMPGGHLLAADDGLHYLKTMDVPREYMNEDSSSFDDVDEVYAQVHLNYARGGGDRYANSATVSRQF